MDYNAPVIDVVNRWMIKSLARIQETDKIILLARPYSVHPDDWYLSIVMAALPHNSLHPYVTWLHNATGKTADYFCEGHYFTDKFEAFEDWKTR